MTGQQLLHLAGAVAGDDHDPALFLVGVQNLQELLKFVVLHGGSNLDADRVGDAAEVFQVGPVDLASAIPDPDEVGAQVVVLVAHFARERLLQVELHGLVRSEELLRLLALGLCPDRPRVLRDFCKVLGGLQPVDLDAQAVRRVGGRGVGAEEVEGRCRMEVTLQEALGIPLAVLGVVAVDVVALEGHDLPVTLHDLGRLAPRLAVLPGDPGDADGGPVCHVLDDGAHLEDQLELRLEAVRLAIHEALSAVAPLHDEALATASLGEELLQAVSFGGLHERRQLAELVEDLRSQGLILPLCHLQSRLALP
mmetsp:Transcript_128601/g.333428  ORF Transcript_128601/g.333428 Transcript_128601/m.333428 type:complete len:309 (-) Transcript_128601:84-1010(-)